MQRFAQNRWWTLILTLSLLLATSAAFSPAYAVGDGSDLVEIGDGGGGGNPGGDPDSPSGPGKKAAGSGRAAPGGNRYTAASVGDGGSVKSVWVWRFHVVLKSLVVRYTR